MKLPKFPPSFSDRFSRRHGPLINDHALVVTCISIRSTRAARAVRERGDNAALLANMRKLPPPPSYRRDQRKRQEADRSIIVFSAMNCYTATS